MPAAAPAPAAPAAAAAQAEVPASVPASAAAASQPATRQKLQDVVNAAGLTWVETDPDRHAQTQQRMAANYTPVRLGRERKPVPPVSSAPLVQVETRH
jgi:ribonuclease E